jgi:hypothetical protein
MSARKTTSKVPARLERTRQRFERWRETRKVRSRIPESLWTSAVKMARAYGINRTARALRVDYYSLKERVESETSSSGVSKRNTSSTFVELAAPAIASACECLLELEDVAGAKMRIHLKGVEVPDLAALSRDFWGVES